MPDEALIRSSAGGCGSSRRTPSAPAARRKCAQRRPRRRAQHPRSARATRRARSASCGSPIGRVVLRLTVRQAHEDDRRAPRPRRSSQSPATSSGDVLRCLDRLRPRRACRPNQPPPKLSRRRTLCPTSWRKTALREGRHQDRPCIPPRGHRLRLETYWGRKRPKSPLRRCRNRRGSRLTDNRVAGQRGVPPVLRSPPAQWDRFRPCHL
jgi:hypothetical protein